MSRTSPRTCNRTWRPVVLAPLIVTLIVSACTADDPTGPPAVRRPASRPAGTQVRQLRGLLRAAGFTGRVGTTLEARLGRPVNRTLAEVGRMLFFDPLTGLNDDNTCGGCHSPTNGFGDVGSIAIGVQNNGIVGPDRRGPRNQRRTPMAINTAFFPTLMWNSRFFAGSGDPFDNSGGFIFPPPEGTSMSHLDHLLQAQAFIPPTERVEAAGFAVPGTSADLRQAVLDRLNATPAYRRLFGAAFADVAAGAPITFDHFGRAIAEFEFTLVFANAPIDRFARGETGAMTEAQVGGAVLFFGRAGCVRCHAVAGGSNEMFSDFRQHVAGIPQVAPSVSNVTFDGPGANEDFGLEQVSGRAADRYKFRTSPLRNVALQPAFMHDGAFVRLEDAVRYHLSARQGGPSYTTAALAPDLQGPTGPLAPVLERLDPLLRRPVVLSDGEFVDLMAFLRDGLLDPGARPEALRQLVPAALPSGRQGFTFQFP
ncbi:MAG: hypothetical protein OEV95_08995 [Gemmatimonadota bacterium]|nr:hypothetical protein [Gemmatimonadota bacterium]